MRRSASIAVASVLSILTIACREQTVTPPVSIPPPSTEIVDAAHGATGSGFYFLPPLVADPGGDATGDFDATLAPVVEICALGGAGCVADQPDAFPIRYSMETGPGSETIRVDEDAEQYVVNWHAGDFALDPAVTYRIRVLVAGMELGHADVDVVSSGGQLKNVNTEEYVPLKDGRTLVIKFRINQGAVYVVGTEGGTIVAADGVVTLTIPPQGTSIGITVQPATGYPDITNPVPGTTFEFGPEGTTFDPQATLTISYDPQLLPVGTQPWLARLVDGVWKLVPGSTADLAAHTVSAPVTGFSDWTVRGVGPVLTLHVVGGQGEVEIQEYPTMDACSYNDVTCAADFTPDENLTLKANTPGFPDAEFEDWSSSDPGFTCATDPTCPITMDQNREVTARFSMPGLLSLSAMTASFTMPRAGTATPTSVDITASNIGGRSLTLASLTTVYSQNVPPWLDVQTSGTTIAPGSSVTVTLTVLTNTLFPGVYNATVPIFDGGQETGGPVPVSLTVTSTGASVTVNGAGRNFGPLPVVPYAFADDATGTLYPLGTGHSFLFGLFDTGSTRVRVYNELPYDFNADPELDPNQGITCNVPNKLTDGNWFNSDAGHLGLTAAATVRVRLNGLSAIDPDALTAPTGAGEAQVELTGISAQPQPSPSTLDVTLLGSPVALQVVAAINYTQKVTVDGFNFYPDLTDPANTGISGFVPLTAVEGPDITFFNMGDNAIPPSAVQLELAPFGTPVRPVLKNVEFRNQGQYVNDNDPSISPSLLYLYDTGTTPTIIGNQIAGLLNLTAGAGTFSCLDGTNNGYTIDGIVMVGQNGGTYTVNNASVCWSQAGLQSSVLSAVIGSNLFDQVPVVFDGVQMLLGVGTPTASPVIWMAPRRNCP